VGLLLVSIFSILGVNLFSGRLNYCTNTAVLARAECVGNYVTAEGTTEAMEWRRIISSGFDNFAQGVLTVFEICTLEMWPDLLVAGVDSQSEPDLGPQRNVRAWLFVYFLLCGFPSPLPQQSHISRATFVSTVSFPCDHPHDFHRHPTRFARLNEIVAEQYSARRRMVGMFSTVAPLLPRGR
jgi:hypothetical protein